jgi:hypothetical protein
MVWKFSHFKTHHLGSWLCFCIQVRTHLTWWTPWIELFSVTEYHRNTQLVLTHTWEHIKYTGCNKKQAECLPGTQCLRRAWSKRSTRLGAYLPEQEAKSASKSHVLKILDDGQNPNKVECVSKNDPWSVTAGNAYTMLVLLPTELSWSKLCYFFLPLHI